MSEDQAPFLSREGSHTDRTVLRQYPSMEEFYQTEPTVRQSGEYDYGVWWQDEHRGVWRVSWVADTGAVYAVHLSPHQRPAWLTSKGERPVVVIGSVPTHDDIERVLEGWGDQCGKDSSLYWVFDRLEQYSQSREFSPLHPVAKAFAQAAEAAGQQEIQVFFSLYSEQAGVMLNSVALRPSVAPLHMLAAAMLLSIRDDNLIQRIALLIGVLSNNQPLIVRALQDTADIGESFTVNAPNGDASQLQKMFEELARQEKEVLRQRSRTPDRDRNPDRN